MNNLSCFLFESFPGSFHVCHFFFGKAVEESLEHMTVRMEEMTLSKQAGKVEKASVCGSNSMFGAFLQLAALRAQRVVQ